MGRMSARAQKDPSCLALNTCSKKFNQGLQGSNSLLQKDALHCSHILTHVGVPCEGVHGHGQVLPLLSHHCSLQAREVIGVKSQVEVQGWGVVALPSLQGWHSWSEPSMVSCAA